MKIKAEYLDCQVTYNTGFITRTVKLNAISNQELKDLVYAEIIPMSYIEDQPKAKIYKGVVKPTQEDGE